MSWTDTPPLLKVRMQFSPGVWTDVTTDVIPTTSFGYGINGDSPNDRVADSGPMSFALDNTIYNSVHLEGAYTPGHANCRSGFDYGIKVQAYYVYTPSIPTYYKWQGKIDRIEPLSAADEWRTLVTCSDWMDELHTALVPSLTVQLNKRSDELMTTLLAAMANPPDNTAIGFGMETLPVAFDTATVEDTYAAGEAQKITNSEMGFLYPRGDASLSGLVAFEDRRRRGVTLTSVATFTASNVLRPVRDRKRLLDRVQVKIHPRDSDASATPIFTLDDTPPIVQKTSYGPMICTYKDNSQTRVRIGAVNQLTPVATTDYLFNTAADGSGTDITAAIVVTTCTFYGDHAEVTLTNSGSVDGYLTFFRIRGQGYYDEGEVVFQEKNTVHQGSIGDRPISFEMPYQGNTAIAAQAAKYLLAINDVVYTLPESYSFMVQDDASAKQAIQREISDRITIQDVKSGISADFFIQSVLHTHDVEGTFRCEWGLVPAGSRTYWILDSAVYSVLGSTTVLTYGLWNQFWILGSSSLGVLGTSTKLS